MNKDDAKVVDFDVILQRTKSYGNNFPTMKELWKTYFKMKYKIDIPIQDEDVPFLMQLHKISRLMVSPNNIDSMQDMFNYAWIGFNYDTYSSTSKEKDSIDKSDKVSWALYNKDGKIKSGD